MFNDKFRIQYNLFFKNIKRLRIKKNTERIYYAPTKNHRTSCPLPSTPSCVFFLLLYLTEKIYFPFCISSENVSKHFYVVLPSLLENEILSLKSYPFRQNLNFLKIITLMSKRITESFIMIFGTYLFLKVRDFYKVLAKTSKYLKGIQHLKQTCTLKTQIDIRTCIQNHVTDMSAKSIYHLAKQYGWEE